MTIQSHFVGIEELCDVDLKTASLIRKLANDCRAFLQDAVNSAEEFKHLREIPPALFGEALLNLVVRISKPLMLSAFENLQRGGSSISKEKLMSHFIEHLTKELSNKKPRKYQ
jgi:hypothetical protein